MMVRSVFFVLALAPLSIAPAIALPRPTKKVTKMAKQILIYAHRRNGNTEYVHDGKRYSPQEMDFQLGEWHVDATKDSAIVVVLEDYLLLSNVKDAPAMARRPVSQMYASLFIGGERATWRRCFSGRSSR
jgi:hypothetical protein